MQIGPFKDELGHRWTVAQQADVQHVFDNLTYNSISYPFVIRVRFTLDLPLTPDGDPAWGYQYYSLKLMKVRKSLTVNERRYVIAHEFGHFVDAHYFSAVDKTSLKALLGPQGVYDGWKAGPYRWMASECHADSFAKIYAGVGASWTGILPTFFRRQYTNVAASKTAIESATGGDGEDGPGDSFPGVITFPVLMDLARRKRVSSDVKQASGQEQHLPMGFLGVAGDDQPDYVYDALLKADLDWIADIERVKAAQLELTVLGDPTGTTHITGSGVRSFLRGQRVLQSWNEGDNAEGVWDNTDWASPSVASNVVALGSVGYKVAGTRMHFDVLPLIRQWAPASVSVEGLGAGENNPNHGLRLSMAEDDKIAGATEFASSEHPTTAYRPTLYLEYIPVSAKPVAIINSPVGNIASNIFAFTGEYDDPVGNDRLGKIEWKVRKVTGAVNVWTPAARIADANEEAVGVFSIASSAPGAPAWLAAVNYEWQARIQSKNSGKWSVWTEWTAWAITNVAPSISATSLGSKATLDGVFFGGPYTDPDSVVASPVPPLGFPRMSMWRTSWKAKTLAEMTVIADAMVAMNQRGVVLMGKDWGGAGTELPADPLPVLDMFIAKGITPYVGLWMAKFDLTDRTAALAAWNAGVGRWAGAILDVEAGWKTEHVANPATSEANATTFVTALRAAGCTMVGFCSYGVPEFHLDVGWNFWNSLIDLHLPQVYFAGEGGDDPADVNRIYNRAINSFNQLSETFTQALKPIVIVNNLWGAGAYAPNRKALAVKALAAQGAISWWKHPVQNSEVVAILGTIPRDVPASTTQIPINMRIQLRPEAVGNVAWDTDVGTLWDTGEQPLMVGESNSLNIRRLYRGQRLAIGTYTYRVAVQDVKGAWSAWSYATVTLTVAYEPDTGAIDFLSGYRRRSPVRIVIRDMTAQRGPGAVKAILYDASNIGASKVANDIGEFYFTIPTTHPQAQEIEPLQRHYALEFYRGGNWMPLFDGIIVDMDANEDDVIFFGLDYLGLLSKNIEDAFFTTDNPEASIDGAGSKYIDKNISYVIKDQLTRGQAQANSPIAFISVEPQASAVLMEAITTKVSINAAFRERLGFILGLIQSAKQGTGNRSRLYAEKTAAGTYRWRYENNAGTTRDHLRLKYGELVQGFRIVLLGQWAAKVYGVGRITNEVKPRFKSATAPGIDTAIWGNVAVPAVWQDLIDENDLQRRVKQLAMEMGKFGKSVAIGLRVSGLEVFDGWDLLDSIPVEIVRGAVDTTRYGSGYWTIQGVEYRLESDGHDELTLAIKPREDITPPDANLIPSKPISTAIEWGRTGLLGVGLTATSTAILRDDGTVAARLTISWTPLAVENFDLYGLQVAANADGIFTEALLVTTPNAVVTLEDMLPGTDYSVRVGAYDRMGNFSGYSAHVVATAAVDAIAPSVPTGLFITSAIRSLLITWQPVTDSDLSYYQVAYRVTGSGAAFTVLRADATSIVLTGLQADDTGTITYDVKVRAVDTTGNESAYGSVVIGIPLKVNTDDIVANSVNANHIVTIGLDASVIKTGTLSIGGVGTPPSVLIYNVTGQEIGRIDAEGVLIKDPTNTLRQMRFQRGVLEFTDDGGVTWATAISADGIVATNITTGQLPGGQNLIPNSSFEMAAFSATTTKLWDLIADWGTTIGTDVNLNKTTNSLQLTTATA